MRHRSFCLGALAWALSALCLAAAPLPAGSGQTLCPNGSEPIDLYTYKPSGYKGGPLFVVFAGGNRFAEGSRDAAKGMADRFGALIIAPLFDAGRFSEERYQFGGIRDEGGRVRPRSAWTYAAVARIIAYVRGREGAPALPCYLIGHSGGGQFLVRLAAFLPGDTVRIVAANPGSELFPSRDLPFGYGFGGLPLELSDDRALRAYLAAPLTLYLGTGDVYPRPSFDGSPPAMRQGASRLERGRACFAAAAELARQRGWAFHWRKVETPGIGHDEAAMYDAPEMAAALFGK